MTALLADPETYETFDLDMTTAEGRPYTARIVGRLIAGDPGPYGQALFVSRAGVFVFVDVNEYYDLGDKVEDAVDCLREWLAGDDDEYFEACDRLGVKPVIELGVREDDITSDVERDSEAAKPAMTEDEASDHSLPLDMEEREDHDAR